MKYLLITLALLGFGISSCTEGLTPTEAARVAVVQGYLYANEPVHDIRLISLIPYAGSDSVAQPLILKNKVVLHGPSGDYPLTPDDSGYYHSDHIVLAGEQYTLSFSYGNEQVTATTVIPKGVTQVNITSHRFVLDSAKRVVLDRGDTVVLSQNDTLWVPGKDTIVLRTNRLVAQLMALDKAMILNTPDTVVAHRADTLRYDSLPRTGRSAYAESLYVHKGVDSVLYLIKKADTVSIANRSKSGSTAKGDTLYRANGDTLTLRRGDTVIVKKDTIRFSDSTPILIESSNAIRQAAFGSLPLISWLRGDTTSVYVKISNIDAKPKQISSSGGNNGPPGGFGGNFRFTGQPTRSDSLRITTQMVSQYGDHLAIIYRVNQEYLNLFISSRAQANATDLYEPLTNVTHGLGIFTAFAGDTTRFTVAQPAPN